MKSPTEELPDLCPELDAEPRPGFTGGLDLYDELIRFVPPSAEERPWVVTHDETVAPPSCRQATSEQVLTSEPYAVRSAADSGALPASGDVIKITGALAGFDAARTAAMSVCGECGSQSDGGEMFCIHCGGLLDAAAASAEAALALAGLCDECGAMIEDDEIFCPSCGSVMTTS